MRAVRPLISRNLRRGRGQFAATTLLVVIAAMLLDLAIVLSTGYSRSYEHLTDELRTPQAIFLTPAEDAAATLRDHLVADPRVSQTEVTATRYAIASLDLSRASRFSVPIWRWCPGVL